MPCPAGSSRPDTFNLPHTCSGVVPVPPWPHHIRGVASTCAVSGRPGPSPWSPARLVAWGFPGRPVLVGLDGRCPNRQGTGRQEWVENRYANKYGTSDVGIRFILSLFGFIWDSGFMVLSSKLSYKASVREPCAGHATIGRRINCLRVYCLAFLTNWPSHWPCPAGCVPCPATLAMQLILPRCPC